jgi:hypothetical protein
LIAVPLLVGPHSLTVNTLWVFQPTNVTEQLTDMLREPAGFNQACPLLCGDEEEKDNG